MPVRHCWGIHTTPEQLRISEVSIYIRTGGQREIFWKRDCQTSKRDFTTFTELS